MLFQQCESSFFNKSVTTLLSAVFTLGFVSMETPARAQKANSSQSYTCSNRTLKGTYGLQATGFQTPLTPVTAVRTSVFDGNGNFTGNGYISIGGNVQPLVATGTYQVNSNCTVTITGTINGSPTNFQFGVIVNRGREILTMRTDSGQNLGLVYKRVD